MSRALEVAVKHIKVFGGRIQAKVHGLWTVRTAGGDRCVGGMRGMGGGRRVGGAVPLGGGREKG